MKVRPWIWGSLAVVLIAGCATGGWYLYQHHLSDDVRRLLVAANDEHASQAETHEYTAQVRPLVRTKRDREVVEQFETALALLDRYQEDQREDEEQLDKNERNERYLAANDLEATDDECYAAFREFWRANGGGFPVTGVYPSTEVMNESHKDLELGNECAKRRQQAFDARLAHEKSSMQLAFQDMNSVRKAIGLPPLPESK
jgi:hypothetical protein